MTVSVCVSSIRANTVGSTIQSICRQSYRDLELILTLQGDDERLLSTVAQFAKEDSRIRVIHLKEFGKSCAMNAGVEAAQGSIVCFTDDDCEANEDWLQTIVDYFEADPGLGVVGGRLISSPGANSLISFCHSCMPEETYFNPKSDYDSPYGCYWCGANVAIRKSVLLEIGPFDSCLGPGTQFPACEDTDYMFRIKKHGFSTRTTPKSIVHHTHGRRDGLKVVHDHFKSYAIGQGAYKAKQAMIGYVRPKRAREKRLSVILSPSKLRERLKNSMMRRYQRIAYKACMENYIVDETGLLQRKTPVKG